MADGGHRTVRTPDRQVKLQPKALDSGAFIIIIIIIIITTTTTDIMIRSNEGFQTGRGAGEDGAAGEGRAGPQGPQSLFFSLGLTVAEHKPCTELRLTLTPGLAGLQRACAHMLGMCTLKERSSVPPAPPDNTSLFNTQRPIAAGCLMPSSEIGLGKNALDVKPHGNNGARRRRPAAGAPEQRDGSKKALHGTGPQRGDYHSETGLRHAPGTPG
ncbi:hypothetical protein AAFF_G00039840 [Aldrovandia affinis]|uniref:Uncharacterized protein n=1 Tax=Aldrovandia affinis TaxID=143900 RepID=A0AAD7S317_9TELE|nr:hypothetical protein AAFF_G00039840 [Aldrovandia affinis]